MSVPALDPAELREIAHVQRRMKCTHEAPLRVIALRPAPREEAPAEVQAAEQGETMSLYEVQENEYGYVVRNIETNGIAGSAIKFCDAMRMAGLLNKAHAPLRMLNFPEHSAPAAPCCDCASKAKQYELVLEGYSHADRRRVHPPACRRRFEL